ncbi:uncharacterized protein LOC126891459 [Diabrotica virgifera virgifera]|uniref:Tc1-like transposase DDE domain-containing protein n=1 Tax=Diabrotica virgifera virgifera TaxID=50390 RepID=A0ABM5L2D1_DIAVI|nr:uncharacterized protein LOC126891459 [Diabrotica virgifera virgifera]
MHCYFLPKTSTKSYADYHEDMTAHLFEKLFKEQLLPNIPPNSVIVMGNASYHSRLLTKIPNSSTKKDGIVTFLRDKNIPLPKRVPLKKDLLNIVKSHNFKKEYVLDEFCKTQGHTILRLPPYYCIFNPIEMIWGIIKSRLRKCNQSLKLSAVLLDKIRQVVNEFDSDIFKNCISHVIDKENEYPIMDRTIAPIFIQPNLDTDSSSDDYNSD